MGKNKINNLKNEIELIKLDIYENEIIIKKYKKKVDKEKIIEQRQLLEYATIEEVQEAYGFGEISDSEYDKLINYFENKENEKSINEMFLEYVKRSRNENTNTLKYLEKELFNEELVEVARS